MPIVSDTNVLTTRAWYASSIEEFLQKDDNAIIGELARNSDFSILETQRDAWFGQIHLLQKDLCGLTGSIFLEFNIPRMGRRIDAVILSGSIVFAIEFKVGEAIFDRGAIDQVWDYALDLKNFHSATHLRTVVPLLVVTGAEHSPPTDLTVDEDKVVRPIPVAPSELRKTLDELLNSFSEQEFDHSEWANGHYLPTPTIIEAARSLYAQHSVREIARHDAGGKNLAVTSARVEQLVDNARQQKKKMICFVTGVPGAGKTLVGLDIATKRRDKKQPTHAVFLSGNGPLVDVLREALTRDELSRRRSQGETPRKSSIGEKVKAFIQNVHHFRDDLLKHEGTPAEHVVIFDEAQRAWTLEQTAKFMQRKRNRSNFSQSEPEFLISGMDRHRDWSVVICLVGGGQEINTGEAGIDTWIEAIETSFPDWEMHISSKLTDSEYAAGHVLERVGDRPNTFFDDSLHLAVSMRSFRAESVSQFVKAALDIEVEAAKDSLAEFAPNYPIVITRDLVAAKEWVRNHARGSERFGLIASSKAQRLKPDAIDVRVNVDPIHWFLNGRADTRSSFYLEDAATEYVVQGLELDWACVAWDGDFRFNASGWSYHRFRGNRWVNVKNEASRRYLRNAYRVLLTRARQGMVIYVPQGNPNDPTRCPDYYDPTYQYLLALGITKLD